jgi:hypothetical protein
MKGSSKLIGIVLLALILFSGVGYVWYRVQLDTAVSELDIYFDRIQLKSIRLIPSPQANLTLTYVANNTNDIEFRVTMNGELYYGTHFITYLTVTDALIRANGLSTLQMDVTITGTILNTINPEDKNEYIVQGDLVATAKILGLVPVTVTKPLSDYRPGHN